MRKLCCSLEESTSSLSPASHSQFPTLSRPVGSSHSRLTFADSVMNRTLQTAEPIILKWNPETTTVAAVTSLFYEDRREAQELIQWLNNLQKAMRLVVMENSNPEKLVRAQNLMQIAMKRLQKEFYQILTMNRAQLDPESVSTRSSRASTRSSTSGYDDDEEEEEDDDVRVANRSISEVENASRFAMVDLKLIAECMISCGYGKECVKVYKSIRKSIVDEGIYRLGVEKLSPSHIHKMNWEVLDVRIKTWLNALETAVKTLFDGERTLCDHVFASSDSIRESCFTEIATGGATLLLGFPENALKNGRKLPETVFRVLDMYVATSNHLPEIESIFSFDSTANIKLKAQTVLITLREYVKVALNDFEYTIQKESSKTLTAGAGIHDLTIEAMNYLSLLSNYRSFLTEIFPESPPPEQNLLPESYSDVIESSETISVKMSWLVLAVLCRLDTKSKLFKDVSLSYLFLANNLQYIVSKVRCSNLRHVLGEKWLSLHDYKVEQFVSCYERMGWSHVIESLPSDPSSLTSPEQVKEAFKKFNLTFDEVCDKHSLCVVTDARLRDDIKDSLARKVFWLYREFYNTHVRTMEGDRNSAVVVRFTPDDVRHRLSDLFFAHVEPGTSLSFNTIGVTPYATR